MVNHISTKYILEKYDISRQTLYNWISDGLLVEPEKDWRGWRKWTKRNINEIEKLLDRKKDTRSSKNIISTDAPLEINNRRYLGSKQKLVEFIDEIIKNKISEFDTFFEPFGGTGVISNYYNNKNKTIIINDILKSNCIVYDTFFSSSPYDIAKINEIINSFNEIYVCQDNYFSSNFGDRYFTVENSRKIGFIRDEIDILVQTDKVNQREKNILITSLLYATDKVANTCGHYDAYREKLDSTKAIELLVPHINNSVNINNKIYNRDANDLVKKVESDVTYIDTPYNSRQYCDAYHLLENIALNAKPELIGKARKMKDRRNLKSNYCTVKAVDSFKDLIENLNTKHILVSYNNMARKGNGRSNAKISNSEIVEILSSKGNVEIFETDFNAFTTGKSKIDDHKELVYYCKVF